MLYNPDWARLPSFKAFVEKKDPNESYCYSNSMECACAQYLKSEEKFTDQWLADKEMTELNKLAGGSISSGGGSSFPHEWTFGRLLDRINAKEKELV